MERKGTVHAPNSKELTPLSEPVTEVTNNAGNDNETRFIRTTIKATMKTMMVMRLVFFSIILEFGLFPSHKNRSSLICFNFYNSKYLLYPYGCKGYYK